MMVFIAAYCVIFFWELEAIRGHLKNIDKDLYYIRSQKEKEEEDK